MTRNETAPAPKPRRRKGQPLLDNTISETDPSYGLHRGDDGKPGAHWQVFLTRQRHPIVRIFYDRTYGGAEGAREMAVAYRDAIVAEIPRVPVQTLYRPRPASMTGKVGVSPFMKNGELAGYTANLIDQGVKRTRLFSFDEYRQKDALGLAEAQRDDWLAELVLAFSKASHGDYDPDNPYFSELFLEDPHWDEENDAWLDGTIANINAHFDALRPLWLTIRVAIHPGERLQMNISDGGYPAQERRAAALYGKRKSLNEALETLRDKAVTIVRDLFGIHRAAKFLARHGHEFDADNFDREKGISIRERA